MAANQQQFGPVTVYFGDKNGKYPDGNQVVVRGSEATAVFDTPLVANRLAGDESSPLARADMIILGHVHEDHVCGIHLLPDAPVYAPEFDVDAIRSIDGMMRHYSYSPETWAGMREKITEVFHYVARPDAQGYGDGAAWDLGGGVTVRAIHAPGHTRGHSILWVEPGDIAFIGDIDLSGFGPYYADGCSNLSEFRMTLTAIEHLDAKVWITSHHKGVVTERYAFLALLEAFRGKIDLREQAILEFMGSEGKTLDDLVAHRFMYPPGHHDLFVDDAERKCIREHLAELLQRGAVREDGGVYRCVQR